ncbi:MAG: monofunctional biosynthetic peptidoglycan transglycosylase [Prevotellaceae bacterium]|nr:monofunctional biosynthetic peptidoglycan transglycosylase [Prevotella sp.]MDD7248038.1 monofunctional biosynthetic peptidoglycan transglycosylase [Prevotellaceae bacterium]MDY2750051.1 monofunctional biosynthetic peptidoglycan transglycosylase [Prevotella sp.]
MRFAFSLIGRVIKWMVVAFFASTLLAVVALKVMPVWFTPLMFIRAAQHISDGEMPRMHHRWVTLEEISPEMPVAVMASEDQRFLIHHGFDFDAIQKAVKRNMKAGKKKYGASTISQQTAKNVFLWPGRSWLRKGLEMYFTTLIELIWGKERIMEVYLNSIEMGDGIYGVDAVAQYHFGKTAETLSRRDCALIAATLPNPRRFSSKEPSKYMRKRQRQILKEMKFVKWKDTK